MVNSHDGGDCQRPWRISFGCWNMTTLVLLLGVSRQGGRGVVVDRKVEVGRSWNVVRRFFWISVAEFSGDTEGMSRIETSDN